MIVAKGDARTFAWLEWEVDFAEVIRTFALQCVLAWEPKKPKLIAP